MVRAGLHLMLCCFVTVEGTVGVRYKVRGFFFHMELGFFFFLLIFWSFETVDMLLRSHLWVAASYSSHPFMDLLSSFVDNPLIKYECFLVIVSVKKKKKKCFKDVSSDTPFFPSVLWKDCSFFVLGTAFQRVFLLEIKCEKEQ